MKLPASGSHHQRGATPATAAAPAGRGTSARPYPPPDWRHRVTEKQLAGMQAALREWRNTRQLAAICGRASGNAAERLGFVWLKFGVDHDETEERDLRFADHCLYAMAYPRQKPPTHKAMTPTTWARLCIETGWKQTVKPHLDRTSAVVEQKKLGLGV